jgi:hypothetical protein
MAEIFLYCNTCKTVYNTVLAFNKHNSYPFQCGDDYGYLIDSITRIEETVRPMCIADNYTTINTLATFSYERINGEICCIGDYNTNRSGTIIKYSDDLNNIENIICIKPNDIQQSDWLFDILTLAQYNLFRIVNSNDRIVIDDLKKIQIPIKSQEQQREFVLRIKKIYDSFNNIITEC